MREPTEMELRVARTLNPFAHWDGMPPNSATNDQEYFRYVMATAVSDARKAIRAMREPTKEMLQFLSKNWDAPPHTPGAVYPNTQHHWRMMIDAASPPEEPRKPYPVRQPHGQCYHHKRSSDGAHGGSGHRRSGDHE